jgi:hypothetical protein
LGEEVEMALEAQERMDRGNFRVIDLLPWRRIGRRGSGPIQRLELLETLFRVSVVQVRRPGDPEAKLLTVWLELSEEPTPEGKYSHGGKPRKVTLAVKAEPKEVSFFCLLQGRILGAQELRESLEVEQIELLEELNYLQSEVQRLSEENRQLWTAADQLTRANRGLPRPTTSSS